MKRWLFEIHRWVGIVLAVFMVLWFGSGLLIVFADPTTPSRAEQWAHAESLRVDEAWISAGEAWALSEPERKAQALKKAATGKPPIAQGSKPETAEKTSKGVSAQGLVEARLVLRLGEPVWLIEDVLGRRYAISALDGKLHTTSSEQAVQIAANWLARDRQDGISPALTFVETVDKPALLRNQEGLSPFHRVAVQGGSGREFLISARTGEVLSAATRVERAFYWAGNWVHLFRPLDLAGWGESRVTVLTWVSFFAVLATLTGLIIGWLRWRPGWFGGKTYSEGRTQPYRNFWFKWHFWAGLVGGIFALGWGLSGYLNNNPWQIFAPAAASKDELVRYFGSADVAAARSWKVDASQLPAAQGDAVELVWRRLGEETVHLTSLRDGRRVSQSNLPGFSSAALTSAVQRIVRDAPVAEQSLIREYDSYYYLRHHRDVADRPLPVVRIELNDDARTHMYIDPQDGRLLLKQDSSRRVYRWLYSALHHWDFGWLYQRPFWDVWMVIWVAFGLTLSVSSVVLGWRRLVHTFSPKSKKHPQTKPAAMSAQLATESSLG